jgi:hypothetical protein
VANSNRKNNSIESLMVKCTISTNHSKIREHIVQYYSSLYTNTHTHRHKKKKKKKKTIIIIVCILDSLVGGLCWMTFLLNPLVRLRLIGWREFEGGEVFEVVKAFNSNKALSTEGFSYSVLPSLWGCFKI